MSGTHLLSPPEAFIWLGDVIYGDSIIWPFEFIRYASSMEVREESESGSSGGGSIHTSGTQSPLVSAAIVSASTSTSTHQH